MSMTHTEAILINGLKLFGLDIEETIVTLLALNTKKASERT